MPHLRGVVAAAALTTLVIAQVPPPWVSGLGATVVDTTNLTYAVPTANSQLPAFNSTGDCLAVVIPPSPSGFLPFTLTGIVIALSSNASITFTWCAELVFGLCTQSSTQTFDALEYVGPDSSDGAYYLARLPFGWAPSISRLSTAAFWCELLQAVPTTALR